MLKKLMSLGAMALLAMSAAAYSAPASATNYYFVSICGVVSPVSCAGGPNPVWFGPYSSYAQCDTAWALFGAGLFGQPPRSLTSCFPY